MPSFVVFASTNSARRVSCPPYRAKRRLPRAPREAFPIPRFYDSLIWHSRRPSWLGGSVCVYGVLAGDRLDLAKGTGPYNFNLFMHQWPTRDAEAAAQAPLVEWIRAGKLSHEDFKTSEFPLHEIEAALKATESPTSIKTMLRF